jgi:putative ABC transport system permease protein
MITGYKQLTGKYLKASKKRTTLTIVGIVLSIALISAIGLFFNSMQIAQIEDARNDYGSFHIIYNKTDEELISKVINNPKIARYGFFKKGQEFEVGSNLTVGEVIATDKALELLPFRIKEGKLPVKSNEVAIEKWILGYIDKNAKIGDKIKLKDREYNLAGILENSVQTQVENQGVILLISDNVDRQSSALAVEISSETNIKAAVQELKQLADERTIMINNFLLMMQGAAEGSGAEGLYSILFIIIGIVVISTIAVIYNSFQISVVERIKQFGLLRAIGITPKQIRRIILGEASILAAIGLPLGLLLGVIAHYTIGFVFKIIGGDSVFNMSMELSPKVLLASVVLGLISIYISALIPAFYAGRISPLVAISSRASITKEKIKRRKSMFTYRLFGFEGTLASKNIKRNRKRYRITVFSIVISVVLFITFKSLMDMSMIIATVPNESKNIHFSIARDNQSTQEDMKIEEKLIEDLKSINAVEKVYGVYEGKNFKSVIDKNREIREVKDIEGIYSEHDENKTILYGTIVAYDKESFEVSKNYLDSGSVSPEKLNAENGVIIINRNSIMNGRTSKKYYGPIADMKVGDEIELQYDDLKDNSTNDWDVTEFDKNKSIKVKVAAVLNTEPFNFRGTQSGLKMITTTEVLEKLTGGEDIRPVNLNIKIKDVEMEEVTKTAIENAIKSNPSLRLINIIDNNRKEKSSNLMVQILIYGFVIVISLIGSVNIINTLTTNIILRKREFAALRSIGLTQRGLRKMIVLEGLLYGVMGTIYGSIIGCLIAYMMYGGFRGGSEISWHIPWEAMAIAGSGALIIGYLSVLVPLGRIKKENLVEAIREEL